MDDEPNGALRIGELVRLTGKTSRTLHFYEELGLLQPIARTKGGFRLYNETALLRIRWIERLQELGFSLPEIQDFLARLQEEAHGPDAMLRLEAFYRQKLDETRVTLNRLRELERSLQASIEYLTGCRACDPLTHRSECPACDGSRHKGQKPPEMVAAVHDPA